jgi:hypothetical protein
VKLNPDVDTSATLNFLFARHYGEARKFHQAVVFEEKALDLANAAGEAKLAKEIRKWLDIYKQLADSP